MDLLSEHVSDVTLFFVFERIDLWSALDGVVCTKTRKSLLELQQKLIESTIYFSFSIKMEFERQIKYSKRNSGIMEYFWNYFKHWTALKMEKNFCCIFFLFCKRRLASYTHTHIRWHTHTAILNVHMLFGCDYNTFHLNLELNEFLLDWQINWNWKGMQ